MPDQRSLTAQLIDVADLADKHGHYDAADFLRTHLLPRVEKAEASLDVDPGWCVSASGSFKRIHRSSCRYARDPYKWAAGLTGNQLLERLVDEGAVMWHLGCRVCCPALDEAIREAQQEHTRRVVMQFALSPDDSTSDDRSSS